jgi:hypothetical protein
LVEYQHAETSAEAVGLPDCIAYGLLSRLSGTTSVENPLHAFGSRLHDDLVEHSTEAARLDLWSRPRRVH